MPESCLYIGEVVHKRFAPVLHELRYRVFNVFIDVDGIAEAASSLRLFNYNRPGLLSIRDHDHGPGDGTPIRQHAWTLMRGADGGEQVRRIFMFCYPRVLGYVFNPLTVYYGFDGDNRLRMMIYEVNNTFGGRHSYVVPVEESLFQQADKHFFVSPFNKVEGRYSFHFTEPGEKLALGVALSVGGAPVLKAYVSGTRRKLDDTQLFRSFASVPLLTLKVIGGIHFEALRLWWKGLKLNRRPKSPNHTIDVVPQGSAKP